MLLEKLLAHLELEVEPFALCDLSPGARLQLAGPGEVVLHFVLEGSGILRAGGIHFEVSADSLVVVPRGLRHSIETGSPIETGLDADERAIPRNSGVQRIELGAAGGALVVACGRVRATYGGSTGIFDRLNGPLVLDGRAQPALRAAFAALADEQFRRPAGGETMAEALMRQCLVVVLRLLCEQGDERLPWLRAVADERLGRALDAILDHPERGHTLDDLAATAGMSRSAFSESFARHFGRSPGQFLREARLRRGARMLLTTDLPIGSVARRVGFASRSHFSRAFAAELGKSPSDFRLSGG